MIEADGLDPDEVRVGIGAIIPAGQSYYLWEARRPQAEAVLEALADDLK